MRYEIKINNDKFNEIKSGKITVDLGVNSPERQPITSGDIIAYDNENGERIYCRVTGYYVYQSFEEFFKKVDKTSVGFDKDETPDFDVIRDALRNSDSIYGVKGVKIEYVSDYKELKDMTESEVQAYLQGMITGVQKARKQLFKSLEKADGITAGLAKFIQSNPDMYFAGISETDNDMFKYLLNESIKNSKTLLDTIQEYEDKTGFTVLRKY